MSAFVAKWILFCDTDPATGDTRPVCWNLVTCTGNVHTLAVDTDVRSLWEPGDVMAYYPLEG